MDEPVTLRMTEVAAISAADVDAWMARRVERYGAPCLTRQEYRAVVYSLLGLPAVAADRDGNALPLEQPAQRFIAKKMRITQGRVSQLLKNAAKALRWFELHGVEGVGWERRGKHWHFRAPVRDNPVKTVDAARVQIYPDVLTGTYRLTFAGEI